MIMVTRERRARYVAVDAREMMPLPLRAVPTRLSCFSRRDGRLFYVYELHVTLRDACRCARGAAAAVERESTITSYERTCARHMRQAMMIYDAKTRGVSVGALLVDEERRAAVDERLLFGHSGAR